MASLSNSSWQNLKNVQINRQTMEIWSKKLNMTWGSESVTSILWVWLTSWASKKRCLYLFEVQDRPTNQLTKDATMMSILVSTVYSNFYMVPELLYWSQGLCNFHGNIRGIFTEEGGGSFGFSNAQHSSQGNNSLMLCVFLCLMLLSRHIL